MYLKKLIRMQDKRAGFEVPSPMKARPGRKIQARRRLKKAAELICAQGFDAHRCATFAAHKHAGPARFTIIFPSKEDMFAAIHERVSATSYRGIQQAVMQRETTAWDRLERGRQWRNLKRVPRSG